MQPYKLNWVRLPLERAYNVRELGGYPVPGGQTAYHRFLRGDDLSALTDTDVEFLRGYGVTTVLDLRSEVESLRAPNRMAGQTGVRYYRIPLMGRDITDATQVTPVDLGTDIGHLYLVMLEQRDMIREIFSLLAAAPEGCVLFHCAAGKDRTGILAMLLLSLAGADREDCMTNYAQSYPNLCRNRALFDSYPHADFPGMERFRYSHPESILPSYELVTERFGGTAPFLEFCGISPSEVAVIRARLLGAEYPAQRETTT